MCFSNTISGCRRGNAGLFFNKIKEKKVLLEGPGYTALQFADPC